jgi:hypothetical protein
MMVAMVVFFAKCACTRASFLSVCRANIVCFAPTEKPHTHAHPRARARSTEVEKKTL